MNQSDLAETNIEIKTPDGTCDAVFIHPATGSYPGSLVWADGPGLRRAMRDIGKRLAAEGSSVLVPNPFYRSAKAPVFDASFNFENQADRARLMQMIGVLNTAGAAERDAIAFVGFLDAQKEVDKTRKIGTQGCTAWAGHWRFGPLRPCRIAWVRQPHSTAEDWLLTKPDSPHLLASRIKAP